MAKLPNPLKAVLFDFDGTLADSYPAIAASVNHVRDVRGHPPLSVEVVKSFVGKGPEYLLSNTIPGGNVDDDLATYRDHHPSVMLDNTQLLPGALEALAIIKRSDLHIGLCSNKPRIYSERLLTHLDIADYFDVVLGPEDVERIKPAPDMLHSALDRLQIRAEETLYVGDMRVDIQTARGAGVTVWVVPTGSDTVQALSEAAPDRLLADLAELVSALESR